MRNLLRISRLFKYLKKMFNVEDLEVLKYIVLIIYEIIAFHTISIVKKIIKIIISHNSIVYDNNNNKIFMQEKQLKSIYILNTEEFFKIIIENEEHL